MSDPIAFPSSTPALGLPLLIAGQAQKEFFVNHALSLVDALLTRTVLQSRTEPPTDAIDGTCYRVTAPAAGQWQGYEDRLAVRLAGDWHFVAPQPGWRVFDQQSGQIMIYRGGWQMAPTPETPSGGATIDTQARTAIEELIEALRAAGILMATGG